MALPAHVRIVEVGPRDGLQNEAIHVSTETKLDLIDRLAEAGLRTIEAGSFVSPKWVPQMADTADLLRQLRRRPGVTYPVLVPNEKGLERALHARADEVAVFAAASEAFSRKNINCTIEESLARFGPVIERAKAHGVRVRGYVSCVLGCPYQGRVPVSDVVRVGAELFEMGCYEISLGDTIGVGTPIAAQEVVDAVSARIPIEHVAVHFHDTYGQALANIFACLERGVSVIDASVGGLGGCPYAKGASGNVATEDVVYMLDGMGVETGVTLDKVIETSAFIARVLGRLPQSHLARSRGAC